LLGLGLGFFLHFLFVGFLRAGDGLVLFHVTRFPANELEAANLDIPPRHIGVALTASVTISTIMDVDVAVACAASRALPDPRYRCGVAVNALHPGMSMLQLEAGLVVIEAPNPPIARVVAGFTVGPEAAHVYIVFLMARPTIGLGVLEGERDMTFFACDQCMQPG